MSSAAWAAQHPALPATPADISAAIYAAQQRCRSQAERSRLGGAAPGPVRAPRDQR